MDQLSGMDASFLHLETPETPMQHSEASGGAIRGVGRRARAACR